MKDAAYWIEKLGLEEHPEGGYFKQTYRSEEMIEMDALPDRFGGARPFSTAIYYLLKDDGYSAFHRIKSDELWHFYTGSSVTLHIIGVDRSYSRVNLGSNHGNGEVFQAVVRAGSWFGVALNRSRSYALMGCTVAPGFDFQDFELGSREGLAAHFPELKSLIEQLTR